MDVQITGAAQIVERIVKEIRVERLTKREEFAKAAMQALLSDPLMLAGRADAAKKISLHVNDHLALEAFAVADAMIEASEKK